MVCEEDIGWRDQSRKVIIYTTDQSFHIAMDGKLGGIVTPNDGKCHLNPSGYIYIICRKNKIFFFREMTWKFFSFLGITVTAKFKITQASDTLITLPKINLSISFGP